MSSFSGLNTALTALYAQRRGLDVTGQNVANANTAGYTRQRVVQESIGAPATPALWATYGGAGGGVSVSDVQRLRDVFLESRAHTEHGRAAYLSGQQEVLARVEQAFGEPGDTGLQAQLSDFWSAWGDVVNRAGDASARTALVERGATLADGLRAAHAAMDSQWTGLREQLGTTVDAVNTAAATIAELNTAIVRGTQAGLPVNELADRRDLLVMQLADQAGARARPGTDGAVDVFLGGTALVRGSSSERLAVAGAAAMRDQGGDPVRVTWARDGYAAELTAGTAGGMLQTLTATIPRYVERLDGFAAHLSGRVNATHAEGFDLDGVAGTDFFSGSTAATISVAIRDPRKVAASGVPGGGLDGSAADRMARIAVDPTGPDATYRQLVVDLGVEAQNVNRRVDIQADVTAQVDGARESHAGVNMDEEMVNLLSYQRAYEGAARVLTAVDEALETLINRTGLVGR